MTEATTLEGGCFCGAIRYRLAGALYHVSHCHCSMCRRAAGAPMVTWATVRREDFAIVKGEPAWYRSSSHAKRGFCPACGTPLLFASTRHSGEIDVTVGSFDDPGRVKPTHHVYAPDHIAWVNMNDGLPRHVEDSRSPLI